MSKVMLIDDDERMHMAIERLVVSAGYDFCGAFDGVSGLDLLAQEKPDLLLLDVMIPGMNGFEVCRRMRSQGRRIPIVFPTAKGDIVDKSVGFDAGGDDYVVKPFSNEELLMRIKAHLRRHQDNLSFAKAANRGGSYAIGDLEVLFNRYEVRKGGVPVELTSKEFEVLALMAANPGQVFSRAQIYESVWGEAGVVDDSSVTVFVHKIREKIEDNPSKPQYLLTVWRVGYKLADRLKD